MIAITCRKICREPFLDRLRRLAEAGPEMIVLREKDLPHPELLALASECKRICDGAGVPLSINTDIAAAKELGIGRVHLPLPVLRASGGLPGMGLVGASVHSPSEAAEAESLGADYLIAGHIFPTACKIGEPRGTPFLRSVCEAADIPVYGVGGITPENFPRVLSAGAEGAAVMSSAMLEEDVEGLVRALSAGCGRDLYNVRPSGPLSY